MTDCASGRMRPSTTGTPSFRIPAFSAAMLRMSFPKNCWWSHPILVTDRSYEWFGKNIGAVQTATLHSRFPNTTASTCASANQSNANPKVTFKKRGLIRPGWQLYSETIHALGDPGLWRHFTAHLHPFSKIIEVVA